MKTILNVLAKIKMGAQSGRKLVRIPCSRFCREILIHLKQHNLIRGFDWDEQSNTYQVYYRHWSGSVTPLEKLKVVSKPSSRNYISYRKLITFYKKKGHVLVSTPYGLRNHKALLVSNAAHKRIGGEALAIFKH